MAKKVKKEEKKKAPPLPEPRHSCLGCSKMDTCTIAGCTGNDSGWE